MAESEKETASQGFHFIICFSMLSAYARWPPQIPMFVFFFRQSQSYLHTIAKIWEGRRDIDILERVLRESEEERAVLTDYIHKEVIQEEDVNRYSVRKEIHTRKFPSSCIVHFCRLFLTFDHFRCLLSRLS